MCATSSPWEGSKGQLVLRATEHMGRELLESGV